MIFFTADHHFGHANVIRHCNRPFQSVAEMDEVLIENWNAAVGQHDTVHILGDLFFRNKVPAGEYLQRLNGRKHLIIGNHDKDWMKRIDLSLYFESVERMVVFADGAHRITLCHYPMMSWSGMAKGSFMIHGHIHNSTGADYFPLIRNMPNLLNAGVDINDFKPVPFSTLFENNRRFKEAKSQQH